MYRKIDKIGKITKTRKNIDTKKRTIDRKYIDDILRLKRIYRSRINLNVMNEIKTPKIKKLCYFDNPKLSKDKIELYKFDIKKNIMIFYRL